MYQFLLEVILALTLVCIRGSDDGSNRRQWIAQADVADRQYPALILIAAGRGRNRLVFASGSSQPCGLVFPFRTAAESGAEAGRRDRPDESRCKRPVLPGSGRVDSLLCRWEQVLRQIERLQYARRADHVSQALLPICRHCRVLRFIIVYGLESIIIMALFNRDEALWHPILPTNSRRA